MTEEIVKQEKTIMDVYSVRLLAVDAKLRSMATLILELEKDKVREKYSSIEFNILFVNEYIADLYEYVSLLKIDYEKKKLNLKSLKSKEFMGVRASEGVSSDKAAEKLIELKYSEEDEVSNKYLREIQEFEARVDKLNKKHKGYTKIAEHLNSYFIREQAGAKRTT